ncbi:NlpC/P60 family protein [Bosea sp. (in: a-proteobacteria)]|uniref:NlpC/P60 family protein n=1 Tax=Bosea sp. (in: a-proteobacteria) TaxID=1871050 RepID=UPI002635FFBC|nr:NlpC/P60 family protein [Bosea sp. (in: a-proteobacteria)]MCO5092556.1 NlpC/P60 family protein [Bosea sp. (in: a-proteobacteria)]
MRRAEIVAAARLWLGTPYHHQASLCGVGCDCLGLVRGVWRELCGAEPEAPPPYSQSWAESLGQETLALAAARHLRPLAVEHARPGDALLFRWREHLPAKHCAILSAPGSLIHAHDGAAVAEVAFTPWWRRHLSHAFSFPGVTD